MDIDPEQWLKKNASWNQKKTIAKTTVFQVPIDLLVRPRNFKDATSNGSETTSDETVFRAPTLSADKGLTCGACRLQFSNVSEQHAHFKSDFHRCNLQRSVKNQSVLTEEEFLSIKDKDAGTTNPKGDSLLLESDDSSSESDADSEDRQEAEWDEEASIMTSGDNKIYNDEEGTIVKEYSKVYGPQFVFQRHNSQWRFTISLGAFQVKSLFHDRNWHKNSSSGSGSSSSISSGGVEETPWSALSDQLHRLKGNMLSCVFLLRSGRFAGAVIENGKILVHKVLRRYTVRAKAGGGQSSHDNKSGKAHSAGAMLRRYGEQALREDIQSLLTLWSAHVDCCHTVYISAPKTMRAVFFEAAKDFVSPLTRDDARITYIPFMTDRPTLEEIRLVYTRCTSVIFMRSDDVSVSVDSSSSSVAPEGDEVSTLLTDQMNLLREDVRLEMSERRLQKQRRKQARQQQQQQQLTGAAVVSVEGHLVEDGYVGLGNRLVECPPSRELLSAITSGNERLAVRLLKAFAKRFSKGGGGGSSNGDSESDDDQEQEEEQLTEDDQVKLALALSESVLLSGDNISTTTATTGSAAAHEEPQWDLTAVVNLPDSLVDLSTPLHLASARSMHRLVSNLLRAGASPCALDVRGRPPYFLASDGKTREAFRRYRGSVGEARYDWAVSGVGPPLTEELVKAARAKEKEKKRRAQQRKKETKRAEEVAAVEAQQALDRQRQAEVEAEARRQREAGRCGHCQVSLYGIKSFDVFDRRCCSGKCVIALRRTLAGEAAMKRMAAK